MEEEKESRGEDKGEQEVREYKRKAAVKHKRAARRAASCRRGNRYK
jgi:hypothetical protein